MSAVLVYSGKLRKNQKRPLTWTNDRKTYNNCSKLIDAIFNERHVYVKRDKHVAKSRDGKSVITTRIKYNL